MGHPALWFKPEEGFYAVEVFGGVYAYGVVLGFGDVEGEVVFE